MKGGREHDAAYAGNLYDKQADRRADRHTGNRRDPERKRYDGDGGWLCKRLSFPLSKTVCVLMGASTGRTVTSQMLSVNLDFSVFFAALGCGSCWVATEWRSR